MKKKVKYTKREEIAMRKVEENLADFISKLPKKDYELLMENPAHMEWFVNMAMEGLRRKVRREMDSKSFNE